MDPTRGDGTHGLVAVHAHMASPRINLVKNQQNPGPKAGMTGLISDLGGFVCF